MSDFVFFKRLFPGFRNSGKNFTFGTILCCLLFGLEAEAKPILLRNGRIDVPDTKSEASVSAQSVGVKGEGLYLIQLRSKLNAEARTALKSEGIELVRPIPSDAFVVRLSGSDLAKVKRLPIVNYLTKYEPQHKTFQALADQAVGPAQFFQRVSVLVSPKASPRDFAQLQRLARKAVLRSQSRFGKVIETEVLNTQVMQLAESEAVLWVEPAKSMQLFDEAAVHIIGGEAEGGKAHVHELGFDGQGVVVAVADSGLQDGIKEGMHPDLANRVDAFFYYGNLEDASDEHSHGTHVTGIVAGDGATGEVDEFGYLYGLGIAPKAHIVAQRIFDGIGGYEPPDSNETLTRDAVRAGAVIGSNSWGDNTNGRYDISAMEFDGLVRDADQGTPGDQPYILEFSAGNAGPGERTIGSPAVGKNVIATGASQNNRFDMLIYSEGQEYMADFSSRGPAEDGRIKPDLVAPGTWIASLQSSSATDENAWGAISPNYQYQGGTSQSGPQVSGGAAVFVQYYRSLNNGKTPSPALTKAALINSTIPLEPDFGAQNVPNMNEGWGRMDLTEIIGSNRKFDFTDQTVNLATGQTFEKHFVLATRDMPLKITMAYTDVPGFPPAIPALVNDLDLELVSPSGIIYRGNQFLNGESVPQAAGTDALNNVEGIFLSAPEVGEYTVRIKATAVQEDSRSDTGAIDQDFALAISGGIPMPGQGVIALDRRAYRVPGVMAVKLIDFDLGGQQTATVQATSSSQAAGLPVVLRSVGRAGVFTGAVDLAAMPVSADGKLHISHGDTISVTYQDASPAGTIVAIARADFQPPVITDVGNTNRFSRQLVSWTTDEPANSTVFFRKVGESFTNVSDVLYVTSHELSLGMLEKGSTYEFYIVSTDEAGNVSTNNNNGQFFRFEASGAATVLLVNAYTHSPESEAQEIPVSTYTDALDQTGISYEVWNIATEGAPTLNDLKPYRIVMWRINDSFYEVGNTISASQQTMIQEYLDNRGSFFMASMDILSRVADTPFATNVLQVAEFKRNDDPFGDCSDCDEDSRVPSVRGASSDLLTSGMDFTLDYSLYPVFELEPIAPNIGPDLSDVFVPTTNAAPILFHAENGRVAGIKYPRSGQDSSGRVVFLSVPLDAIPLDGEAPNNRASVLINAIGFLAPGVDGRGTLSFDQPVYKVPSKVTVEVLDSDLTKNAGSSVIFQNLSSGESATAELEPTVLPGLFRASITLAEQGGVGKLSAADSDTIIAEYEDKSSNLSIRAAAVIDTFGPDIFSVEHSVDYEFAEVYWNTTEPTDALVQFGESRFLGRTAYNHVANTSHSLLLTGLQTNKVYYYQVVSRDEAGNVKIDDNNGEFYTFKTLTPLSAPWTDALDEQGDWYVFNDEETDGGWELGVPSNLLASEARSPENAWGSNLYGSGRSFVRSLLVSPAVALNGGNQATLKFWHNYDFLNGDATFETGGLYIYTNSLAQPILLRSYDELTFDWEEEEVDLTPYMGNIVQLAWSYELLDFGFEDINYPGWLVDDVSIEVASISKGRLEVTNNLAQASFAIEGPSPGEGTGRFYSKANALTGNYTVTFNPVPFYKTPAPASGVLAPEGTLVLRGNYTFTDANNNGISDEWEQSQFGQVSGSRTKQTDTDKDGFSDWAEFLAGTDPNNKQNYFSVGAPSISPDRRVMLEWSSVPGRSYRIMGCVDGKTWTAYSDWLNAVEASTTFTVTSPENAPSILFQIEVAP